MSTVYEVPTSPQAQYFQIALAGIVYKLNLYWGLVSNCWVFDLFDTTGNPILQGIPMVTGVDLLAAFPDLNLGGQLVATTDTDPTAPPTFTNLGSTGHLLFVTTP